MFELIFKFRILVIFAEIPDHVVFLKIFVIYPFLQEGIVVDYVVSG